MPTMPIETATTAPSLSGPGIASDENMPENDLVANTPVEEVPVLSSEIDAPDDSDATLDVTIRSKNQRGDEDGIRGDHPPPLATSGDDIGTTARSTFSTTEHTTTTSTSEPSQGFALEFEDICLTAQVSRWKRANNSNSKAILHGLTGHIPAGKVTALMGGSGSGKSSLIKILTGRIGNHSKNTEMSGRILLDGNVVDPTNIAVKRNIAYVEQDVSIPATCTPREAIFFSARLRLDQKLNDPDIDQLVDNMLEKLNLRKSANTIMGGGTTLGSRLSGGEQKRVQCGIELVTQPIILVCDEPLTGLDSYSAEMLVDILKRTGATILLSIHQPSPLIVRKLDHLILLQSGRLVFDGAMNHSLSEFFARKGFAKPDDYNISDWIMVCLYLVRW
jgi:ABC-type multidrug transport system ATPase subunit